MPKHSCCTNLRTQVTPAPLQTKYNGIQNCAHLSYYDDRNDNSFPTVRDNLSVLSARVQKPKNGTDRLSRNVGKNYHYSLRNSPEECGSNILRGGRLKLRIIGFLTCLVRGLRQIVTSVNVRRFAECKTGCCIVKKVE
jgi:hypothetical protein